MNPFPKGLVFDGGRVAGPPHTESYMPPFLLASSGQPATSAPFLSSVCPTIWVLLHVQNVCTDPFFKCLLSGVGKWCLSMVFSCLLRSCRYTSVHSPQHFWVHVLPCLSPNFRLNTHWFEFCCVCVLCADESCMWERTSKGEQNWKNPVCCCGLSYVLPKSICWSPNAQRDGWCQEWGWKVVRSWG